MFLTKRKNGIYYIIYENRDGKKLSKSTRLKHKAEAIKFLKKFRITIEDEMNSEVIPIRAKKYFFEYLRYSERHLTWKTIKIYQTTFKFFLKYFGDIFLSELSMKKIEDFLLTRAGKTSIFAARKDLTNLSAAFNKAVTSGYLKVNPCAGIRRYKIPERQPIFFSSNEFEKLLDVIPDQDLRELVIFALNTGCRQGELIQLKWRQVDLSEKLIILDNQTSITKSKKVRSIPLNPDALEVIIKRLNKRTNGIENVFTQNNKPFDQYKLSSDFKKYIIKAEINNKLHFHSLRHSFASHLVQAGVSIYVVSKLLGHADIKTTQIYAHLRREDLHAAVNVISKQKEIPEEVFG